MQGHEVTHIPMHDKFKLEISMLFARTKHLRAGFYFPLNPVLTNLWPFHAASNQRVPGFNPAKKHDPHLNAAEIRFESRSNKPDFHGQSSRCALAYDTGDEESGIDVASHSNSFETRTDRSSPAPQSGKGSPRSIIAAHATLLRALSAYTVMRYEKISTGV